MAGQADLPAIVAIYNEVVRTSTAIYRDQEATLDERMDWWLQQQTKGYPLFVAEDEGQITGFASYGDFRSWPGYRFTVEASIHLRSDARRSGTGSKLLHELIAHARTAGKHMLIAGIDSENVPSRRFMEKNGAEQSAYLREVGFKFGRYLDLMLYQIRLS